MYTFASQTQMADVIFNLMHCSWDFSIGIEGKRQINTGFYKKGLCRVKFNTQHFVKYNKIYNENFNLSVKYQNLTICEFIHNVLLKNKTGYHTASASKIIIDCIKFMKIKDVLSNVICSICYNFSKIQTHSHFA